MFHKITHITSPKALDIQAVQLYNKRNDRYFKAAKETMASSRRKSDDEEEEWRLWE